MVEMVETEIRVMQLQAEGCWQPPEARKGKEGFSPRAFRESHGLFDTLISDF